MLDPDYIDTCADDLLAIYERMTTDITKDIARSIARNGALIQTAAYQTEMLQSAGKLLTDVVEDVAGYSATADAEIAAIYEKAALTGLTNDAKDLVDAGAIEGDLKLSASARQALDATILKTQGDLKNLTMTTATSAYQTFISESNSAYMKVVHGGYSQEAAITEAVKNCAKEGAWVNYGVNKNGAAVRARIDVAVRRNIQTGVNQTCGALTEMWAEDMGCEYYEVSAHEGARPSHQEWEGQVYKIDGEDAEYKNFYEETGYGDVDGLCGVNCRHSFYPFWPGISKRNYSADSLKDIQGAEYEFDGRSYSAYECSQIQRGYEREIRESKRTIAAYEAAAKATMSTSTAAELAKAGATESANLKATQKAMRSFCEATNRRVDYNRTRVVS